MIIIMLADPAPESVAQHLHDATRHLPCTIDTLIQVGHALR